MASTWPSLLAAMSSLTVSVTLVHLGPSSEENANDFHMAFLTRYYECSRAVRSGLVHLGPSSEENANQLHSAVCASNHHNREFLPLRVGARSVDVWPPVDQSIHHTHTALLALPTGSVQHRVEFEALLGRSALASMRPPIRTLAALAAVLGELAVPALLEARRLLLKPGARSCGCSTCIWGRVPMGSSVDDCLQRFYYIFVYIQLTLSPPV